MQVSWIVTTNSISGLFSSKESDNLYVSIQQQGICTRVQDADPHQEEALNTWVSHEAGYHPPNTTMVYTRGPIGPWVAHLNIYVLLFCVFRVVQNVCFCTGHFAMAPLYLTCLHCLQHFFFEHLFNLYWIPCTDVVLPWPLLACDEAA